MVWIISLLGIALALAACGLWYVCTDKHIDASYLALLNKHAYQARSLKQLKRIERRLANYVISRYTHRLEHHAAEVRATIHRRKRDLLREGAGDGVDRS